MPPRSVEKLTRSATGSSRGSPMPDIDPVALAASFAEDEDDKKPVLNMVVVGHVDVGKSTLMGHFLVQIGHVAKKVIHK